MVCSLWFLVCGFWSVVCGLWFVHLAVQVVAQILLCWTHPAPTMGAGDNGSWVVFNKAVFMS